MVWLCHMDYAPLTNPACILLNPKKIIKLNKNRQYCSATRDGVAIATTKLQTSKKKKQKGLLPNQLPWALSQKFGTAPNNNS